MTSPNTTTADTITSTASKRKHTPTDDHPSPAAASDHASKKPKTEPSAVNVDTDKPPATETATTTTTPSDKKGPTPKKPRKKKRKNKGLKKKLAKMNADVEKGTSADPASTAEKKKAVTVSEKTMTQRVLNSQYLNEWSSNRLEWKFQKGRQNWLLKHLYSEDDVKEEDFKLALKYIKGLPFGAARQITLDKAKALSQTKLKSSEDSAPTDAVEKKPPKREKKKKTDDSSDDDEEGADETSAKASNTEDAKEEPNSILKNKEAAESQPAVTEAMVKRAKKVIKTLASEQILHTKGE
ncbi:hypothetical protein HDV05_004887 [Chytridiales sp. JEL 0842]|nr:hypothetical protein HDV05_004887 [Chytridiales sp. JEL 0842]